jgi:hypothetical protein
VPVLWEVEVESMSTPSVSAVYFSMVHPFRSSNTENMTWILFLVDRSSGSRRISAGVWRLSLGIKRWENILLYVW